MSISEKYQRIAELGRVSDIIRAANVTRRRLELCPHTTYAEPTTETERMVKEIWLDVLSLDDLGVDDNFFEVAGDSLRMTQVLVRIRQGCGADVPIDWFFEGPTVRCLARIIDESSDTQQDARELVDRLRTFDSATEGDRAAANKASEDD